MPCIIRKIEIIIRKCVGKVKKFGDRKMVRAGYKSAYQKGYSDAMRDFRKEPKARQFAEWVATEIFDENWEYNKDAFAELACRKLAKLGIVRAKGNEWELIEQEKVGEEYGDN